MKRFTETLKWQDPWYRKLPCRLKLLWQWLCDNCDHAGVLEVDWELASFQIGETVISADVAQLSGRVEIIGETKLHVLGFVEFQFGALSKECKAHIPVFKALAKHRLCEDVAKGIHTLQEKEQDKEKEKDRGVQGGVAPEGWLAEIERMDCYRTLSVRDEFAKASLKCRALGEPITRRYFVNWLNNVTHERTKPHGTNGKQHRTEAHRDADRTGIQSTAGATLKRL